MSEREKRRERERERERVKQLLWECTEVHDLCPRGQLVLFQVEETQTLQR